MMNKIYLDLCVMFLVFLHIRAGSYMQAFNENDMDRVINMYFSFDIFYRIVIIYLKSKLTEI